MSNELRLLIDKARTYRMTTAEREEQMVSFVYGNVGVENPAVTRESVRKVVAEARPGVRDEQSGHEPR